MPALTMRPAVLSELGRRENNEDAVFASPRLAAVADGVGGAVAGELASRLAINKMIELDKRRLAGTLEEELCGALTDANAAIAFTIFADRCREGMASREGMATTLTAVALSNDGAYLVANIGDSRAYLLRDALLRRMTRDDSVVQELIDQGVLSEDEARRHPQRSVVLEVLDGVERPLPKVRSVGAQVDDRLLLCSDGVTDYLTDAEIAELLKADDSAIAVRHIVSAALDRGSRDNVTAVVADVTADAESRNGWLPCLPLLGRDTGG